MPPPKRPKRRAAGPASGLPSSMHSDTDSIVASIINTTTSPEAEAATNGAAPETVTTVGRASDNITWAPIEELAHRPDNPRWAGEYDPEQDPELAGLIATLAEYDVLQPVTVTSRDAWLDHHPNHADQLGDEVRWVVVMGNRRLAGARHKGLAGLPIHRNDTLAEPRRSREAPIIENYQRKPLDPIREAAQMVASLKDSGESRRAFAERMGMSHSQVNQRMKLLSLIPEFQGMVSDQQLTVQKALPIADLDPEQQQTLLELGAPYRVSRLTEPSDDTDAAETDALVTTARLVIQKNSTPAQIVDTLLAKLDPELLHEVRTLLNGQ